MATHSAHRSLMEGMGILGEQKLKCTQMADVEQRLGPMCHRGLELVSFWSERAHSVVAIGEDQILFGVSYRPTYIRARGRTGGYTRSLTRTHRSISEHGRVNKQKKKK